MRDLNSCVALKGLQFCPKKLHEKYDFCPRKKKYMINVCSFVHKNKLYESLKFLQEIKKMNVVKLFVTILLEKIIFLLHGYQQLTMVVELTDL